MSTDIVRRALHDATYKEQGDHDHEKHLLPCKTRPRKYKPPGGNYAIVATSEEFLDVVRAPGRGPRLIRVAKEVKYLDILEPFIIPQGVNASFDCQGAVVNFAKVPADTVARIDTTINMFGCCMMGMPVGPPYRAERGTYKDVTLNNICEVCF